MNEERFAMYHIAAMQIQWGWRTYCQKKFLYLTNPKVKHSNAAKIQRYYGFCVLHIGVLLILYDGTNSCYMML